MTGKTVCFLVSWLIILGLVLSGCSGDEESPVQSPSPSPTQSPVQTPAPTPAGTPNNWTLIKPEGIYEVDPVEIAPRLETLAGKTIALRWNGKPGGEDLLNGVAERLAGVYPEAEIIKLYDVDPVTATYGSSVQDAADAASHIAKTYHPDIVIASQAD